MFDDPLAELAVLAVHQDMDAFEPLLDGVEIFVACKRRSQAFGAGLQNAAKTGKAAVTPEARNSVVLVSAISAS